MSSTVVDPKNEMPAAEANGIGALDPKGWPVPEFKYRMEDHPLWQEYLAELEAKRQADIAEANRLADLEEETESKK